jgi:hypothetical protein
LHYFGLLSFAKERGVNQNLTLRSMFSVLCVLTAVALVLAGCTTGPAAAPEPKAQAQVRYATPTPGSAARSPAAPAGARTTGIALSTFTTDDFSGSGQCVMCHEVLTDEHGTSVSITAHWRSTMMANAAKDPVWQAKVASEVERNPHLKEVIEKKCGSCHTPMAGEQADVTNGSHALLDDGFFNATHPLHEAAMEGVSCSLCHQVQADKLGQADSFSGGYEIDTSTAPPDRVMFGPYEDPFPMPMQMHSGYLPEYAEHTGTAEFCATCHNLITPYVDSKGEIAGEFPEQTPYTEWQNSAFGKAGLTCQGCHMPQASGGVVISPMPARLPAREPFFQHHFVGGNVFMVNVLNDNAGELGVTAESTHLEATADRAQQQLSSAAGLALKEAAVDNGTLTLQLQVSPGTGHKFPTSFPSRRTWLHVTVRDAGGNIVFESGRPRRTARSRAMPRTRTPLRTSRITT